MPVSFTDYTFKYKFSPFYSYSCFGTYFHTSVTQFTGIRGVYGYLIFFDGENIGWACICTYTTFYTFTLLIIDSDICHIPIIPDLSFLT